MMPFTKEKAKRAEFVIREVLSLIKVINSNIDTLEFIDRGDYEIVRIYDETGVASEIDVTGTSLSELVVAVLERIEEDEETIL